MTPRLQKNMVNRKRWRPRGIWHPIVTKLKEDPKNDLVVVSRQPPTRSTAAPPKHACALYIIVPHSCL